MYIPQHYGSLFPYMIVADAGALAGFLADVFGATELGRTQMPDGRIANLRMRIGTSAFMIGEATDGMLAPMPATYYVYVDDVDRVFDKALACGAEKVFEPADMPYDDRQGGVRDPSGNYWWISRRLVDADYDA